MTFGSCEALANTHCWLSDFGEDAKRIVSMSWHVTSVASERAMLRQFGEFLFASNPA